VAEGEIKKPLGIRVRHWVEYFIVRIIVCTIQIFPIESCEWFAKRFAVFAYDWAKIRRKVITENLQATFPDLSSNERDKIGRDMWEHLFLMICEVAQAPRVIHEATWREYIHIRDKKVMTEYFLDGRPLVMVSGHFGNFEIASYMAGVLGIPTYTMGKPIGNPHIDRFIRHFRSIRGQYLLPYNDSTSIIEKLLSENEVLTLLGDQHAGSRGCWIDFFGRPASCHKALALFTLTQKAPMIVNYTARTSGAMHFEIGCVGIAEPDQLTEEQDSVRGLTQWYNQRLESFVRVMPEQYWWLHKRWKEKPAKRTRQKNRPQAQSPSNCQSSSRDVA